MESQPCSSKPISERSFVDSSAQTDDDQEAYVQVETKILDGDIHSSLPCTSQCSLESSNTTTRRNSVESFNLGTPLRHLFLSTSASSASPVSSISSDENVLDGLNQLLHRITSERFLELRRIQLGDRPVTNSNARENLEKFFNRAINGPTPEQRNEEEQANRPETVANDVQSLIQLSRVQSALQNDFRRQLESALSGRVMTNVSQNNTRTSTVSQMRSQTPQRQNTSSTAQVGGNNFRSRLEATLADRISITANHQPSLNARNIRQPSLPVQRSTAISNGTLTSSPTQQSLPPPPPPPGPPSAVLQNSVDVSVQLLTESIATDLTRLQSLQVVSNMLRADFRQELERLVEQRVETVGSNGQAVEQFVRSLPGNRVHSHAPHRYQVAASTSNEIHELSEQINEMKQMLAMTMEIQLDTQRAIRHEVSAIFAAFMQGYLAPQQEATSTSAHPEQPSRPFTLPQPVQSNPINRGQCVICIEGSVDTVLYQCGHMCVCHSCGLKLKMDGQNCPMCRAAIRDVIRAYVINE